MSIEDTVKMLKMQMRFGTFSLYSELTGYDKIGPLPCKNALFRIVTICEYFCVSFSNTNESVF